MPTSNEHLIDQREQLVNDCEVGPITQVSVPEAVITRLHGIVLDVDFALLRPDLIRAHDGFVETAEKLIYPMLDRSPVLTNAEVRMSGSGLHVIVRFAEPVEFETEGERQRWARSPRCCQASPGVKNTPQHPPLSERAWFHGI